jgi:16S rRNA (cytosine1402-N4)-methyltransferase
LTEIAHQPVLLDECLRFLDVKPGGRYLDATTGLGGHTEALLKASAPDGPVTGLDRDADALARARERLLPFGSRARLLTTNFAEAPGRLAGESFDGILADLGVSSLQLLTPERGFSFMADGPLDMRMDREASLTAAEYLKGAAPDELEELLRDAGEERFAKKLVSVLKAEADNLKTTGDLSRLVSRCIPRRGKSHPATRVFMALRLAVNEEMGSLKAFLDAAPGLLAPGGRLAVISFHSTEDRVVKRFYQDREDVAKVTKSPVIPSWPERKRNPRSRSAKLRVFRKI